MPNYYTESYTTVDLKNEEEVVWLEHQLKPFEITVDRDRSPEDAAAEAKEREGLDLWYDSDDMLIVPHFCLQEIQNGAWSGKTWDELLDELSVDSVTAMSVNRANGGGHRTANLGISLEENGCLYPAAVLIKAFLAKFRPTGFVGMQYSCTCDRNLEDSFGGGAYFVTANSINYFDTGSWIFEAEEKHREAHRLTGANENKTEDVVQGQLETGQSGDVEYPGDSHLPG